MAVRFQAGRRLPVLLRLMHQGLLSSVASKNDVLPDSYSLGPVACLSAWYDGNEVYVLSQFMFQGIQMRRSHSSPQVWSVADHPHIGEYADLLGR